VYTTIVEIRRTVAPVLSPFPVSKERLFGVFFPRKRKPSPENTYTDDAKMT
tara:strand:- start:304 stop:456 length:153 start_codon:yes stop_codon:yes gene_type:complete